MRCFRIICIISWEDCKCLRYRYHIDGLVQERRNFSADALELRLSCTYPWIYMSISLNIYINASIAKPLFQMIWIMTSSFSALLAIFAGNASVTIIVPSQRPVSRGFGVFVDLRLNKRLRKQSRRRSFETPSRSLWRHCSGMLTLAVLNRSVTNSW